MNPRDASLRPDAPPRIEGRVVAPGTRATLALDVTLLPTGGTLQLPLLVARGAAPGQTIVVLGGVHGEEYEGMAAVREAFRMLHPAEILGTFFALPVGHPPASTSASPTSPIHALNLPPVLPRP